MIDPSEIQGPNTTCKRLRFGGTCLRCQARVAPNSWGWHDPDAKNIVCTDCRPMPFTGRKVTATSMKDPVGGASALRWSSLGNRRNRRKGASAEYLMDVCLHRDLTAGEIILNDRRVPGHGGNIDHIVVAHSGVWIIDTKQWDGRIEYKGLSGVFSDERLVVGGHDHTYLTDNLYAQVIPVAEAIGDPSIPIRPALVFVNGNWASTWRLLLGQPYNHNGVCISWPKALVSKIKAVGQLSGESVEAIGKRLDQQLVPM
jgi:hypothetical protein